MLNRTPKKNTWREPNSNKRRHEKRKKDIPDGLAHESSLLQPVFDCYTCFILFGVASFRHAYLRTSLPLPPYCSRCFFWRYLSQDEVWRGWTSNMACLFLTFFAALHGVLVRLDALKTGISCLRRGRVERRKIKDG